MDNNFVYLTYYQAMAFMHKLEDMKKENSYFKDALADQYSNYVVQRTAEIAMAYPQIKLKVFPNADKYKISRSLLDYLTSLTGIDVFDPETMEYYKEIITEVGERAVEDFKNLSYRIET